MTVEQLGILDELKLEFKKKWHNGYTDGMTFSEIIQFIMNFTEERVKRQSYSCNKRNGG